MRPIHFMHTAAGRTLRVTLGLVLLAYGMMSPTLIGIVAMMAGMAAIVTGVAGDFSQKGKNPARAHTSSVSSAVDIARKNAITSLGTARALKQGDTRFHT